MGSPNSIVAAVKEKLSKGGDLPSQRGEAGLLPIQDVVRAASPAIAPAGAAKKDVQPASSSGEAAETDKAESDKDRNFAKLRDQLKEERARREQLERDLKAAQTVRQRDSKADVLEAILATEKPKDFESWDASRQQAWIGVTASNLALRQEYGEQGAKDIRKIALEYQMLKTVDGINPNQAEIVAEVFEASNRTLSPAEARAIAAARKPELFPVVEPERAAPEETEVPPAHRVQEPSRSGHRRAPEDPSSGLKQAVRDAPTKAAGMEAMQRLVKHRLFGA